MKGMTFKEKAGHVWEYYKPHIFTVIAVIIVALYLLNTFVFNPSKESFAALYFLEYIPPESLDKLAGELDSALIGDRERYETVINTLSQNGEYIESSAVMIQLFAASTAAGQVDLVFCYGETFDLYASNSYFDDIRIYLTDTQIKTLEDRFVWYDDEESGEALPMGILMDGNSVFERAAIDTALVAGVVVTNRNADNITTVLSYIFD